MLSWWFLHFISLFSKWQTSSDKPLWVSIVILTPVSEQFIECSHSFSLDQPSEFTRGQPDSVLYKVTVCMSHTGRLFGNLCYSFCVWGLHKWELLTETHCVSYSYPLFPGIRPGAITTQIWRSFYQHTQHTHTCRNTKGTERVSFSLSVRTTFPLYVVLCVCLCTRSVTSWGAQ